MKEVFTFTKPIETIEEEKIDNSVFRKRSNAKTWEGWMIGKMKQARDSNNPEMLAILYTIYQKHREFGNYEKVYLKAWKGKSGIHFINKPDYFIAITFQKKDQDSRPVEVRREIPKKEVNLIISCINRLKQEKTIIPTREIGEMAYSKRWNTIFADRHLHTELNLILRLLDYYNVIRYRGGLTTVLSNVREIQDVLC